MIHDIAIGKRRVGPNSPPLIVAEMSANHNQSLERALAIVDAAADAGAEALKIQTFTPDSLTLDVSDGDFLIQDPKSLWNGRSLHQLYAQGAMPRAWHKPILDRCRKRGLIGFSTPFDAEAVDFLEALDVPLYKIASFENVDLPLIRKTAATGKPLVISTGMASLSELGEAVEAAREAGCRDLLLLKCTSAYPAPPEEANLRTMAHLRELFQCQVGLSDHSLGIGISLAGVAMGASLIERHFTLARSDGGLDSAFSLEPAELAALCQDSDRIWRALGTVSYGATERESRSLRYRRSLYIVRDMKKGEKLTRSNVRSIRPGAGLPPKFYEIVLGRPIKRDAKKGTALSWSLI